MLHHKRPAIVFGEVLCDMFPPRPGVPLRDAPIFVPHIGGAPANVAAQMAWQGWPVSLVSAIGTDPISDRVESLLRQRRVDTSFVRRKPGTRTGLILIEIDEHGERHFYPWREGSADEQLVPADLPIQAIENAAVFHHGTVTLRTEPVAGTNRRAVAIAREAGVMVSIDVNLRPKMYESAAVLYQRARNAVVQADVIKASAEEAIALFGDSAPENPVNALLELGAQLVLLTDGASPFVVATANERLTVSPPHVPVVDTTGAGDAFMGAVLTWLCESGVKASELSSLQASDLAELAKRGAAAGGQAVGAIGALGAFSP